jgi:Cof subfamily protein (haloacid dehalogenase superfamily)
VKLSPLAGVRLVALDLDGTLLPSSKILTDRAVGVLADVRAAGIDVTLATGKGWNHTRRYAEELGLTAPLVALEGAYVARAAAAGRAEGGDALASRTLPASTLRAVHDAVRGVDVGFFYCHDRWRTQVHRRLESWLPQIRIWDPHVDVVDAPASGDDDAPHAAFVFHLIGRPAEIAEAKNRVAALGLPDVEFFHAEFWNGHDQLHVRPAGVEKRTGLTHVLEHLGVAPSQMLAAGDWWNDVGMLRMAGVAVAPANAVEGVRDVAHHVTEQSCEDDGVVRFLEDALRTL